MFSFCSLCNVNLIFDDLHGRIGLTISDKFSKSLHKTSHNLYLNYKKTRKNAIVEYLGYQILVTQLNGPKGNGDMQASQYIVMWAVDRFKRYGRLSGRGKLFFRSIDRY